MGKYTIFYLFDNPRRGMQARSFTTNVPKILDLKSSSEQIFSRKLSLGAPDLCDFIGTKERKEFNSHRTGLGHKHGRRFIVLEHEHGLRDVM